MKKTIYEQIRKELEKRPARSAWKRGVKEYAFELIEQAETNNTYITELDLLNGARNWSEYSSGGCSLIYDQDIAERLCNPTELKKTRNGDRNPNSRETWLDCQARALFQAARIVTGIARNI